MRYLLIIITLWLLIQPNILAQNSKQVPYQPTWESLDKHQIPKWYDNAKIGLSIHWGVYSVPAWAPRESEISYAEWYGFRMHEAGNPAVEYHKENYGEKFTYDDFIPKWKAEEYNPDDWVTFAKKWVPNIFLLRRSITTVFAFGQQNLPIVIHL